MYDIDIDIYLYRNLLYSSYVDAMALFGKHFPKNNDRNLLEFLMILQVVCIRHEFTSSPPPPGMARGPRPSLS